MTGNRLIDIANFYVEYLKKEYHVDPVQSDKCVERAAWCAAGIPQLVKENRIEKALRWLGFIQGVLFAQDIFTIEEIKNHSRSDVPINYNALKEATVKGIHVGGTSEDWNEKLGTD